MQKFWFVVFRHCCEHFELSTKCTTQAIWRKKLIIFHLKSIFQNWSLKCAPWWKRHLAKWGERKTISNVLWQIAPLKWNLSFKCILLWFNYFWLLMFKIISPAFLAAFTLLFAMKPLVPSCVSQTMHLVHQTQRLFYFFKLFIDVSTVIINYY